MIGRPEGAEVTPQKDTEINNYEGQDGSAAVAPECGGPSTSSQRASLGPNPASADAPNNQNPAEAFGKCRKCGYDGVLADSLATAYHWAAGLDVFCFLTEETRRKAASADAPAAVPAVSAPVTVAPAAGHFIPPPRPPVARPQPAPQTSAPRPPKSSNYRPSAPAGLSGSTPAPTRAIIPSNRPRPRPAATSVVPSARPTITGAPNAGVYLPQVAQGLLNRPGTITVATGKRVRPPGGSGTCSAHPNGCPPQIERPPPDHPLTGQTGVPPAKFLVEQRIPARAVRRPIPPSTFRPGVGIRRDAANLDILAAASRMALESESLHAGASSMDPRMVQMRASLRQGQAGAAQNNQQMLSLLNQPGTSLGALNSLQNGPGGQQSAPGMPQPQPSPQQIMQQQRQLATLYSAGQLSAILKNRVESNQMTKPRAEQMLDMARKLAQSGLGVLPNNAATAGNVNVRPSATALVGSALAGQQLNAMSAAQQIQLLQAQQQQQQQQQVAVGTPTGSGSSVLSLLTGQLTPSVARADLLRGTGPNANRAAFQHSPAVRPGVGPLQRIAQAAQAATAAASSIANPLTQHGLESSDSAPARRPVPPPTLDKVLTDETEYRPEPERSRIRTTRADQRTPDPTVGFGPADPVRLNVNADLPQSVNDSFANTTEAFEAWEAFRASGSASTMEREADQPMDYRDPSPPPLSVSAPRDISPKPKGRRKSDISNVRKNHANSARRVGGRFSAKVSDWEGSPNPAASVSGASERSVWKEADLRQQSVEQHSVEPAVDEVEVDEERDRAELLEPAQQPTPGSVKPEPKVDLEFAPARTLAVAPVTAPARTSTSAVSIPAPLPAPLPARPSSSLGAQLTGFTVSSGMHFASDVLESAVRFLFMDAEKRRAAISRIPEDIDEPVGRLSCSEVGSWFSFLRCSVD